MFTAAPFTVAKTQKWPECPLGDERAQKMRALLGLVAQSCLTSQPRGLKLREDWHIYTIDTRCLVTRLCPAACDPMDCSLPGSSVHGILQARVLEWVAISFSRGSSWPRDRTHVSCVSHIRGEFFTVGLPGKPTMEYYLAIKNNEIMPFAAIWWRRQWHPTPVLLPGKSHGWRSLVGCSPWGR